MLSFYEFDCLIKNQSENKIEENDDMARTIAYMKQLLAKSKGAAPAQVAPQATPTAQPSNTAIAPKPAAPTLSGTPTIAPDQTAAVPPQKQRSPRKGRGAIATPSPEQQTPKPAIVNATPDPNQGVPKSEFKRLGMGGDSPLQCWNNMCKSTGNIGGENVSTWAWAMYEALKGLGVQVPPLQTGQPFQIAFAPGASGNHGLPEIVVDPKTFKQANKNVWAKIGNDKPLPEIEKYDSLDAALMQGIVSSKDPKKDPKEQEKEQQRQLQQATMQISMGGVHNPEIKKRIKAIDFNKLIRQGELVGKEMTIGDLTKILASKSMDGGIGQSSIKDDFQALVHLIRTDQLGKYHTFRVSDKKLTPETKVIINPPQGLGKSQDEMGTPDDKDVGKLDANMQRQRTLAAKKRGINALDVPPKVESRQNKKNSTDWMDVVEMMEHWGW